MEMSILANQLIAMMGLPRSGKSTVCMNLSKALGAPIVQRDAIRLAIHGKRFEAKAEPMVKAVSHYMIHALFLAGHDTVICDETNISRAARNALRSDNWSTVFYEVSAPVEECLRRAIMTGQDDLLSVITSMNMRYEPLEADEERFIPPNPRTCR